MRIKRILLGLGRRLVLTEIKFPGVVTSQHNSSILTNAFT